MPENTRPTPLTLEAATVYLLPQHQIILDEVRLKLRRQRVKVNKSQLVRLAIQLLEQQPLAHLIDHLQAEQAA